MQSVPVTMCVMVTLVLATTGPGTFPKLRHTFFSTRYPKNVQMNSDEEHESWGSWWVVVRIHQGASRQPKPNPNQQRGPD